MRVSALAQTGMTANSNQSLGGAGERKMAEPTEKPSSVRCETFSEVSSAYAGFVTFWIVQELATKETPMHK